MDLREFKLKLLRHLVECKIPHHMHDAMLNYIIDRIPPGSFLTAVLENNLKLAVLCADSINLQALVYYVDFLYNHAPATCWGSPAKVEAWINPMRAPEADHGG